MPKRKLATVVAHYAISILGIYRNRIAASGPEGVKTWTVGEDGTVAVYNFDGEHYLIAANPDSHKQPAETTLIFPEAIAPQIDRAIKEGKRRYKEQLNS